MLKHRAQNNRLPAENTCSNRTLQCDYHTQSSG